MAKFEEDVQLVNDVLHRRIWLEVGALAEPGLNLPGNKTKTTLHLRASDGSISAGSSGVDGKLALAGGSKGATHISLTAQDATGTFGGDGTSGRLVLNPKSGPPTVSLDASSGAAVLGGNKVNAFVSALPADAGPFANVLEVSGITMSGDGRVWVGNAKHPGLIMLFGSGKKALDGQSAASILIDGNSGDIILRNADCAEDFEAEEGTTLEPGTVVVLNEEGRIRACDGDYDARVAGIVSGAGGLAPGIVLGRTSSPGPRRPVALAGKAFCHVDADLAPVRAGDLLTTSPTRGHAMRAVDRARWPGAILGKALAPAASGRVLLPVLVTLQ